MIRWLAALALLVAMTAEARPLVIAHRGASAERPEHTLASYRRAIEAGADFIEPDLVSTKDGVLVARHENEISGTTDVAERPEFAARRATKVIDGETVTGWFTEDFTLAELKTLWAKERLPQLRPKNTEWDARERVPTLAEVIAAAKGATRPVGIYPETKHPSYFRSIGLPLEEPLLAALAAAGWTTKTAPVVIQSFESGNLRALRGRTGVRLAQLVGDGVSADGANYDMMVTPAGLKTVAAYADAIAPHKARVLPVGTDGTLGAPTPLVRDAHAVGLTVVVWTLRPENSFLPPALRRSTDPAARGDAAAEVRAFAAAGVDALFSDDPGGTVAALRSGTAP